MGEGDKRPAAIARELVRCQNGWQPVKLGHLSLEERRVAQKMSSFYWEYEQKCIFCLCFMVVIVMSRCATANVCLFGLQR